MSNVSQVIEQYGLHFEIDTTSEQFVKIWHKIKDLKEVKSIFI